MLPTAPQKLVFLVCTCLLVQAASSDKDEPCRFGDIESCGSNELCVQNQLKSSVGVCKCVPGFKRKSSGECAEENPLPTTTPGSLPTASPHINGPTKHDAVVSHVLVPVVLILGLAIVLVYLGHRYNWPGRARVFTQRMMASRRTNDVLIRGPDDDDDPIA
ncbi:Hypothetical predicted protein [Cloeon dipterum]|uniref:EGF-like domain-containing protein n=1 Tax=Cloeon dipterum TaxID=197152 RepID=A0A8S1DR21_9INSE|nr:Hypothetical predicted protein [Cloeon dipterum]